LNYLQIRILAAEMAANKGQIPRIVLFIPNLSTSGVKKNNFKSKTAAAAQVYPAAVSGSMPHAREAVIVPITVSIAPQILNDPGVKSSSPFSSQSLTPNEGAAISGMPHTIVKIALALRAVPNQGKSFKPEYTTGVVNARMLKSPALLGPIVSDSLLSREERTSAIHIKELMVAETFMSYPLKRRQ
jgi:hypothetical protein